MTVEDRRALIEGVADIVASKRDNRSPLGAADSTEVWERVRARPGSYALDVSTVEAWLAELAAEGALQREVAVHVQHISPPPAGEPEATWVYRPAPG